MVHRIEALMNTLQERSPEYLELLNGGMSPAGADRALTERGLVSENELLKLYHDMLGLDLLDEDNFRQPERYIGIFEPPAERHGIKERHKCNKHNFSVKVHHICKIQYRWRYE